MTDFETLKAALTKVGIHFNAWKLTKQFEQEYNGNTVNFGSGGDGPYVSLGFDETGKLRDAGCFSDTPNGQTKVDLLKADAVPEFLDYNKL